jgi:hypothetical protein
MDTPTVIGGKRREVEQREIETDGNHGSTPELTKPG